MLKHINKKGGKKHDRVAEQLSCYMFQRFQYRTPIIRCVSSAVLRRLRAFSTANRECVTGKTLARGFDRGQKKKDAFQIPRATHGTAQVPPPVSKGFQRYRHRRFTTARPSSLLSFGVLAKGVAQLTCQTCLVDPSMTAAHLKKKSNFWCQKLESKK